jgi:hypothetical protein
VIVALLFAIAHLSPTVAILPVVNRTPEETESVREDMVSSVSDFLPKAFRANGYEVIEPQSVETALKQTGVDLEDEELHRRETFLKLGEATKADYVYFATIESAGFFSANTGKAILRVWFLDVKNKGRILSARAVEGEARQKIGRSPKSAEVAATARAAEQSLKMILKHFDRNYQAPD